MAGIQQYIVDFMNNDKNV